MVVIYFLVGFALLGTLLFLLLRPFLWCITWFCPPLKRWMTKTSPVLLSKRPYIIEVQIPSMGGDEEYWFQLGQPRESLEMAKAALESTRRHKNYGRCAMRIREDEYPLIIVMPGDPPLVELH